MLVYAYDRGGAATAGAVAVAQLVPAALLAPVAATAADRRSPVGVLVGGYLVQVVGMLAAAVALALDFALWPRTRALSWASAAVATTRPAQAVVVPGWCTTPERTDGRQRPDGLDRERKRGRVQRRHRGAPRAMAGPGSVFAVAGVAGLVSVLLALTVRGMGALAGYGGAGGLAGTLAGLRLLAREPAPRLLVTLLGAQWVVVGALDAPACPACGAGAPPRAKAGVGYLNMAYGVGGVLAGRGRHGS